MWVTDSNIVGLSISQPISESVPVSDDRQGSKMRTQWFENTSPDIEQALAQSPVVVLPVGSVEQHGHHVPVGCDALASTLVARHAVEALNGDPLVFVLPPLWYGFSPHHMSFAGTVTLSAETFINVLYEVCLSLLRQGVTRVLILNGHGGNVSAMDVAASRIGEEWRGRARIAAITYWHLVSHRVSDFRDSPLGGTGHAGEFETSLMLAGYENLVQMEHAVTHYPKMPSEFLASDLFETSRARVYSDFSDLSPTGTLGDPSLASKAKGEKILTACTEELCAFLRDFATWPLAAPKPAAARPKP